MVEKLFVLRLAALKQRLDAQMLADYFRIDAKAAAMRLLRYHRQGLFYRRKVSFTGKRLCILTLRAEIGCYIWQEIEMQREG